MITIGVLLIILVALLLGALDVLLSVYDSYKINKEIKKIYKDKGLL